MLIQANRVVMRAAESSDAEFVAALLNADESVPAYGPHFPVSVGEAQKKMTDPRSYSLVSERTDGGGAVGFLRFRLAWGESVMNVEDVVFAAKVRGAGYGRESLGALVEFFFGRRGGRRVELQLRADNTRARRTYEALGFVVEGRRRDVVPVAWGSAADRDYLMMGLLATELREG